MSISNGKITEQPPISTFLPNFESSQADGLAAWFPLNQRQGINLIEPIRKRLSVTISGSTYAWTPDNLFRRVLFVNSNPGQGNTDTVLSPTNITDTVLSPTNITVSCWAKKASGTLVTSQALASKGDITANQGWGLALSPNSGASFWINGESNVATYDSGSGATFNHQEWNHYVGVFNGSTITLYVNGGKYTASTSYATPINSTPAFRIGCSRASSSNTYLFDGYLFDLRIYNTALPLSKVAALYDPTTRFDLFKPFTSKKVFSINQTLGANGSGNEQLFHNPSVSGGVLASGTTGIYANHIPTVTGGVVYPSGATGVRLLWTVNVIRSSGGVTIAGTCVNTHYNVIAGQNGAGLGTRASIFAIYRPILVGGGVKCLGTSNEVGTGGVTAAGTIKLNHFDQIRGSGSGLVAGSARLPGGQYNPRCSGGIVAAGHADTTPNIFGGGRAGIYVKYIITGKQGASVGGSASIFGSDKRIASGGAKAAGHGNVIYPQIASGGIKANSSGIVQEIICVTLGGGGVLISGYYQEYVSGGAVLAGSVKLNHFDQLYGSGGVKAAGQATITVIYYSAPNVYNISGTGGSVVGKFATNYLYVIKTSKVGVLVNGHARIIDYLNGTGGAAVGGFARFINIIRGTGGARLGSAALVTGIYDPIKTKAGIKVSGYAYRVIDARRTSQADAIVIDEIDTLVNIPDGFGVRAKAISIPYQVFHIPPITGGVKITGVSYQFLYARRTSQADAIVIDEIDTLVNYGVKAAGRGTAFVNYIPNRIQAGVQANGTATIVESAYLSYSGSGGIVIGSNTFSLPVSNYVGTGSITIDGSYTSNLEYVYYRHSSTDARIYIGGETTATHDRFTYTSTGGLTIQGMGGESFTYADIICDDGILSCVAQFPNKYKNCYRSQYYIPRFNRRIPKSFNVKGAFIPAITMCQQGLYVPIPDVHLAPYRTIREAKESNQ